MLRQNAKGDEGGRAFGHVVVRAHLVIIHKRLIAKVFIVEVYGEITHRPFKVLALDDDVMD